MGVPIVDVVKPDNRVSEVFHEFGLSGVPCRPLRVLVVRAIDVDHHMMVGVAKIRPGASLLVDYTLIPVQPEQYVCADGQVWADVDVSHAALQMTKVFENTPEVREIAAAGQAIIKTEFSYEAIARNMNERLQAVGAI